MGLKKSLTENLGAKIIAVVVAMFIWFNASGQKEVIWLKMVPITLDNIPDSLVITGNIPRQAEISITGNKRQLMLMGFKRLTLGIDLAQATPGRQRVSLSPRQIQLPSGIDRRNVRIIEPLSLDLQLELLVTRRVPVTLSTTGTLPDDLILEGSFSITPSWVSITGPASVAQNIRSMATEALDQSKIKSSFERELPIMIGARQLDCDPDRVTVVVRVTGKGRRVLSNVPPTVLVDSEDYSTVVIPSAVTLTLTGLQSVLDTLSSGDVSVLLNLGGLAEARYRIAPEVILPPGVELLSMNVDSLTVEIRKAEGSDNTP
jgi:YbbR domain-containing protein